MKKKMITLLAFAMITISSVFATGHTNDINKNDVNKNALATFTVVFKTASNVQWETASTYYNASFQMNGRSYSALFSRMGEIIAVSRHILSTELPAQLQAPLPKVFAAYWITDLVKYHIGEETRYYMTVQNAQETAILESIGESEWSVMKQSGK